MQVLRSSYTHFTPLVNQYVPPAFSVLASVEFDSLRSLEENPHFPRLLLLLGWRLLALPMLTSYSEKSNNPIRKERFTNLQLREELATRVKKV